MHTKTYTFKVAPDHVKMIGRVILRCTTVHPDSDCTLPYSKKSWRPSQPSQLQRSMLRKQLVAAIGKEVSPSEFGCLDSMKFGSCQHQRINLCRESWKNCHFLISCKVKRWRMPEAENYIPIVLHLTKMTGGADLRSYMRFHYRKLFLDAYQTLNLTEDWHLIWYYSRTSLSKSIVLHS